MALIPCPECKKTVSDTASYCPKCGYHLTPEEVSKIKEEMQKNQKVGCLIFVIIFIALYLFRPFSSSTPKNVNPHLATHGTGKAVVENSGLDGSVWQVKSWLKTNLKDPDSLEFIEWSPVTKTDSGGYMVRAKYRAKNSFGGYVIENKIFYLDSSGNVVRVVP